MIIGEEKKEFFIHKNLLTYYSGYFKTRFNGNWDANNTKTIELTDETLEVFDAFFTFCYTNRLWDRPEKNDEGTFSAREKNEQPVVDAENIVTSSVPLSASELCAIYVFGDKRDVPRLRSAAVDMLCLKYSENIQIPTLCINYLYENTNKGCGMRRLLVDIHCLTPCEGGTIADLYEEVSEFAEVGLHHEFLLEVAIMGFRLRDVGVFIPRRAREWKTNMKCKYHDHAGIEDEVEPP